MPLASGGALENRTYPFTVDEGLIPAGEADIALQLYEWIDATLVLSRDQVVMASPVNLGGDFRVGDRDYLEDTDGDGVGDINERLERTDPADAESAPGDSTVDVVVLYSQSIPERFGGDPTTRFLHLFSLANTMFADSGVDVQLRVVGMVPVEIDESVLDTNDYDAVQDREARRHGADLVVWYRPNPSVLPLCGFARMIGGLDTRGHFDFDTESRNYATVFAGCNALTLTHEVGHLMGLGHSYWQDSIGTWRWSRGHGVAGDFATLMTYGPPDGAGPILQVFSNPQRSCTGAKQEAVLPPATLMATATRISSSARPTGQAAARPTSSPAPTSPRPTRPTATPTTPSGSVPLPPGPARGNSAPKRSITMRGPPWRVWPIPTATVWPSC